MTKKKDFLPKSHNNLPAGKIQYYFEITDSKGTRTYFKEAPVVIRFKGDVPAFILIPHILFMFPGNAFFNACRTYEHYKISLI